MQDAPGWGGLLDKVYAAFARDTVNKYFCSSLKRALGLWWSLELLRYTLLIDKAFLSRFIISTLSKFFTQSFNWQVPLKSPQVFTVQSSGSVEYDDSTSGGV